MEARAYIKNLKISPKKLRFLLPEIKKMSPNDALDVLFYSPEKSARILYKVIKSAVTNAKSIPGTDEKRLAFKLLTVEGARKLKRFRAGGRGMAKSIMRRFSHIKVILETINVPTEKIIVNPKREIVKDKLKIKNEKKKKEK